ncbi:hypothetical protein TNCV_2657411 [Trichonephila clavipes]|uniref:Tc1-like transposase DDE domain-containing protein n=1 Tax=Trichonephila clavipes TaxID=2585209 RepID=A0A8X6RHU9_TRICX|nr:hypothetical protein TNCV_2657411 [Trichonephila clavipes]
MPNECLLFERISPTVMFGGGRIMDDYTTCHVVMVWYGGNEVKRLNYPALSPDWNPIEILWGEMDRRIKGCSKHLNRLKNFTVFFKPSGREYHCPSSKHLREACPGELRL